MTGRDPKTVRIYTEAQAQSQYKLRPAQLWELGPLKSYLLSFVKEGCSTAARSWMRAVSWGA